MLTDNTLFDELQELKSAMYSVVPRRRDAVEVDPELDVYGVNPDMDSLEYANDIPDWNKGTLEENNDLSFYGLIAIMAGLGVIFIVDLVGMALQANAFNVIGFILALGGTGLWVWGYLKWEDSQLDPSKWTSFRSWKLHYILFWVYVGIGGTVLLLTIISLIMSAGLSGGGPKEVAEIQHLSAHNQTLAGNPFMSWIAQVLKFLAVGAMAGGVFMGWRMKQIWQELDPTRSLAYEEHDYFVWYDEVEGGEDTEFETEEADEEGDTWDDSETTEEEPLTESTEIEPDEVVSSRRMSKTLMSQRNLVLYNLEEDLALAF